MVIFHSYVKLPEGMIDIPSGERLHFAMERSTMFNGKITTISTGPFSIAM